MKQHADNLANRLTTEFQNIENLSIDKLEKLAKKIKDAEIFDYVIDHDFESDVEYEFDREGDPHERGHTWS